MAPTADTNGDPQRRFLDGVSGVMERARDLRVYWSPDALLAALILDGYTDEEAVASIRARATSPEWQRIPEPALLTRAAAMRAEIDGMTGWSGVLADDRRAFNRRLGEIRDGAESYDPARARRGRLNWRDADSWSRDDFIRAVREDQALRGSGSKARVAKRAVGMSPSALWRRWEKVRLTVGDRAEPWPSGKSGPIVR